MSSADVAASQAVLCKPDKERISDWLAEDAPEGYGEIVMAWPCQGGSGSAFQLTWIKELPLESNGAFGNLLDQVEAEILAGRLYSTIVLANGNPGRFFPPGGKVIEARIAEKSGNYEIEMVTGQIN